MSDITDFQLISENSQGYAARLVNFLRPLGGAPFLFRKIRFSDYLPGGSTVLNCIAPHLSELLMLALNGDSINFEDVRHMPSNAFNYIRDFMVAPEWLLYWQLYIEEDRTPELIDLISEVLAILRYQLNHPAIRFQLDFAEDDNDGQLPPAA